MKVIKRGRTPQGVDIQIEDWHESYSFMPISSTLAAYPVSKRTYLGAWAPKAGEIFRLSFNLKNAFEAQEAFEKLRNGSSSLIDYKDYMSRREYENYL